METQPEIKIQIGDRHFALSVDSLLYIHSCLPYWGEAPKELRELFIFLDDFEEYCIYQEDDD